MDIARVTSSLDTMTETLNTHLHQIEGALAQLKPEGRDPAHDFQRRQLTDLKTKVARSRAATIQARDAGRVIAPKSYQTEMNAI